MDVSRYHGLHKGKLVCNTPKDASDKAGLCHDCGEVDECIESAAGLSRGERRGQRQRRWPLSWVYGAIESNYNEPP